MVHITANNIAVKKQVAELSFSYSDPELPAFYALMGVTETTVRKNYTHKDIWNVQQRIKIKTKTGETQSKIRKFIQACLKEAKTSDIAIYYK